ncbi:MAG: DedA family protein [Nitrospirota bacterium]|nr:MAG: DedA family protein [Nitrospirota bacterium]
MFPVVSNSQSQPSRFRPGVIFRSLYQWVIHWSETPHARTALLLIAFAESSFFPVPPDVLLIAMGVGAPHRALGFAALCLVGSVTGGMAGYVIGLGLWSIVSGWFFTYIPGFTPDFFEKVSTLYHDNAFWAVFAAGFSPIPYKVFTLAAGVAQINFPTFVIASILSRGLRFFLIGGALRVFGPSFKRLLEKYFDWFTILFLVLLIGGFVLVQLLL